MVEVRDENDMMPGEEQVIPDKAPEFDVKTIFRMFRERGFLETMEDEVYSPHTHLILVISMIILIAICTAIFSYFL